MIIDLRSDIVSRPTPEMVEAMLKAATSRCSFGFREDPTQNRLEQFAAEILGKEDALFFPTCTMCNQTAIHILCKPGEAIIAESQSHCISTEAGALAALSGGLVKPIRGERGFMDLKEMREAINLGDEQQSRTGLIILENTHNRAGGTVLSETQMKQIHDIAKQYSIPIHLDGARIFNAAIYLKIPASNLTRCADSVAISLNKGLSAPLGAILAGSKSFIQEAGRVRVMLGGGWRPTNVLAAAGIVALESMIDRLDEDHKNAKILAEGIAGCPGVSIDLQTVQTNLVFAKMNHSISLNEIVKRLELHNILILPVGQDYLRMVLHREIREKEVHEVIRIFHQIIEDMEEELERGFHKVEI
jgi:threonine aldolase